jgi:hypothetical protein
MIQANELRIDNYYDQFGNIHQATWVTIKDLSKAPPDQLWCKPIPLIEEWLLKFGFELEYEMLYVKKTIGGRSMAFRKVNKAFYTNEPIKEFYRWDSVCDIEYVHQLQNLYFALTNQELTIKEL